MSNETIKAAFKKGNGKAFIPFVTCGDPDLETTKEIIKALDKAGANLIELGIPFSDPTAEGPVIQGANLRALEGGVDTDKIMDMVAEIRSEVSAPLLFMTYGNIVFHYGVERFAKRAAKIGIDGLILPDTPYEEKEEFSPIMAENDIAYISLIAPTSEDRIGMIAKEAQGFVYCVSSLGVTGTRSEITTDIGAMVELVRQATDIPVAVGFGISSPETAAAMAQVSDGAIVGSAIVKIIAEKGTDCVDEVAKAVKAMADAVHVL
ncbi:MAG: tryptophan synthase subunit alpha [Anaerotardibacter sp.]